MKSEELKEAYKNAGENPSYHFADVSKLMKASRDAHRECFYRFLDIRKTIPKKDIKNNELTNLKII